MCRIAGIASRVAGPNFVAATERMVTALAHREPDSHGVQDLGCCLLGNTRLLVGILFRLPYLLVSPPAPVAVPPRPSYGVGGFQF